MGAIASAAAFSALLTAVSFAAWGPWGAPDKAAFAGHPALMSISFGGAMPLALVAYALDATWLPAPARKRLGDRHTRRLAHAALSAAAAVLCLAGWWVAYSVREAKGKSHLPWGKSWDKQAHIWGGYAAMALMTAQAAGGVVKLAQRVTRDARVLPAHGRVGPWAWAAGCVSLATGAKFSLLGKGLPLAGAGALAALAVMGACVWALLRALPRPALTDSCAERFERQRAAAGGGGGGKAPTRAAPDGSALSTAGGAEDAPPGGERRPGGDVEADQLLGRSPA